MKEYGPLPSLQKMTKEQRLLFGAKLIEAREKLKAVRDSLSGERTLDGPLDVYEVLVFCHGKEKFAQGREESQTASDSEGYDEEMRSAGLARCRRFQTFIRGLLDERLAEIESKLSEI